MCVVYEDVQRVLYIEVQREEKERERFANGVTTDADFSESRNCLLKIFGAEYGR